MWVKRALMKRALTEYNILLGLHIKMNVLPNNFDDLRDKIIMYVQNLDMPTLANVFAKCVSNEVLAKNMVSGVSKRELLENCVIDTIVFYDCQIERKSF